ncbi:hypothetical protein SBBP2_1550007 [Burkholderiales bacterium]|nr:hypothetical protein SBBP2_1550007 [Burkholderiales bacterium]
MIWRRFYQVQEFLDVLSGRLREAVKEWEDSGQKSILA